jgi:hypothetical protein
LSFEPILLAPQQEEKEVFPFRRVWRTTHTEIGILLALTFGVVLATRLYHGAFSDRQEQIFGILFALAPLGLWMLNSYLGERRVPQPRERILTIALLSGLVANAIGIPIVRGFFTTSDWLATASGVTRILGYTLTVGIVQEFLKYAVMRYSVWPNAFRTRSDGIAYALACGLGYATALNLNFALSSTLDPTAMALRVAETTLSQFAISTIVGYFLNDLKINPSILSMPGAMLLASLITGLSIVVRGGLIVGAVSPPSATSAGSSGSTALQGLGVSIFLVALLFAIFYFLINNADMRAQLRSRPDFLQ